MKKTGNRSIVFLALALILAAGSSSCKRPWPRQGEVWALVNGTPIYASQVEALYRRMNDLPGPEKPEQALSFKLDILNWLIDYRLVLQRASRDHITVSPDAVNARIQEISSPYSNGFLREELKMRGFTLAGLRRAVRENLTVQKLIQKQIGSRVTVTAPEIAAYYRHNKEEFNVPQPEYHLAQILVTPFPDPGLQNLMHDDARNEGQALRKIRTLETLLRSGEKFGKVAEEYSEDPRTAMEGGDMGFVTASALTEDPPIWRAVKSLRVGQVSGVIRERKGYCILKLLGYVPAGQRDPSNPQVRETIQRTLLDEKEEMLKAAFVENLRNRARVVDYLAQQIIRSGGSA